MFFRDIRLNRNALKELVWKDIKAKYAGSLLGISWALINPLLMMLALNFAFSFVLKVSIKNYPLFILSALMPWIFFSSALTESAFSIINQSALLRQFNINKELIPLSSIFANFINFLFGFLIIFPVWAIFKLEVIRHIPALLLVLFLHLLFTVGLGLLLSALNVFFRDIGQLLGVLFMLWFWMTPVFYSAEMVPASIRGFFYFNPMVLYLVSYRAILFEARAVSGFLIMGMSLWACASLIFGLWVFRRLEPHFAKNI